MTYIQLRKDNNNKCIKKIKKINFIFYVQNIGRSQSDGHVEEFQKLISTVEVSKAVFTFTQLLVCVLCAWASKSKYIHSCQDGWYLCWKLRRRGCFTYFLSFNSGAFAIIQCFSYWEWPNFGNCGTELHLCHGVKNLNTSIRNH